MVPNAEIKPVTVIREQFTPSPQVKKALQKFVTGPEPDFRLYATGFRVVDQNEYHQHVYTHEIRFVEERLKALGRQALYLSGQTHLAPGPGDKARLLIEPRDPYELDQMVVLLEDIPSLEPLRQPPHYFYVELARNSLVKSAYELNVARGNFYARARHPVSKNIFNVSSPRVVGQDKTVILRTQHDR